MRKLLNKRFVAMLLTLAMVLTLVPFVSFADGPESPTLDSEDFYATYALNNDMTLRKRATLENDGTYTIDLEAWATGDPIYATINNGVPTDIVVVIDQSGSMALNASGSSTANEDDRRYTKLKTALNSFMQIILENADEYDVDHRVALVGFASRSGQGQSTTVTGAGVTKGSDDSSYVNTGVYKTDGTMVNYGSTDLTDAVYQAALVTVGQKNEAGEYLKNTNGTYMPSTAFSDSVDNMSFSGGTNQHLGLEMAKSILDKRTVTTYKEPVTGETKQRQTVVVIFADGEIDSGYDDEAYTAAQNIKSSGTKIFSIALLNGGSNLMDRLSSNYTYVTTYTETTLPTASNNNRNNTYYYLVDGTYYTVTQTGNGSNRRWVYTDANGTQQILNSGTMVYTAATSHVTTNETKYYDYNADPTKLTGIFQTMSQEITAPGTDAPMDDTTIMRDILASGFTFCEGWTAQKNVTVVEQAGAWNSDDTKIEWSAETTLWNETTAEVEVTANAGKIEITGFDYCDNHIGTHAKGEGTAHNGAKLKVKITGIVATGDAVTNSAIYTNGDSVNDISSQCGIFYTEQTESGSSYTYSILFGKPQTILTSETYVLDYAKPATLTSDKWTSTIKYDTDMDPVNTLGTLTYGNVSNNGSTYTPKTMSWDDSDSFYVLANTTDASIKALNANRNGLVWTKVNVLPANNVYYEDTFVTNTTDGTVGIVYNGTWTETGTSGNNGESAESDESATNGGVHGWEDSLADDTTYSDGTAHKADAAGATATFTFKGTGVDIYSYTDMQSGSVVGILYKEGNDKTEYEKDIDGNIVYYYSPDGKYVQKDNNGYYYGTYNSESKTWTEINEADRDYVTYQQHCYPVVAKSAIAEKTLIVDNLAVTGPYYQIPTLSFQDLDYGTYVVKLIVQSEKKVTGTDENGLVYGSGTRSTYYLDGIRVYNPLGATTDAYTGKDQKTIFAEVRDLMGNGDVFIDLDGNGTVRDKTAYEEGEYGTYGPKNEVYLAKDQAITFKVSDTTADYYVGLKLPEGKNSAAIISNGDNNAIATINHSTDMYYKVVPTTVEGQEGGYITIRNSGDNLLSVTKVQMVTTKTETTDIQLVSQTAEQASAEIAAFSLRSTVPYTSVVETEEEVEPVTPPDVDIDNPEPGENEDQPDPSEYLRELLKRIIKGLRGWFGG